MIRAALDTNILISAIISDGVPSQLVASARRGEFVAVCSPYIIDELRRVMTGKLGFDAEEVDRIALAIARGSQMVPVFEASGTWREDAADDAIIETALRGDAAYVVTGDRRLLGVRIGGPPCVVVVTAGEFAELVEGRAQSGPM